MNDDDWFSNFDISQIDLEKLNKYIKIQLKVNHRTNGKNKYIKTYFKRCVDADFLKRGLSIEQIHKEGLDKRFCPDIGPINDFFKIENEYTNSKDRKSFSIEIVKCNDRDQHTNEQC